MNTNHQRAGYGVLVQDKVETTHVIYESSLSHRGQKGIILHKIDQQSFTTRFCPPKKTLVHQGLWKIRDTRLAH